MNRKNALFCLTVFNLVALSVLNALPVHAFTYHGSATDWDYGGLYYANNASAMYSEETGIIVVTAGPGYGNANAFMNSELVTAGCSTDTIFVRVWFSASSYPWVQGDGELTMECKLYRNGSYLGTESDTSFYLWYYYGFEEFIFDDDLDISVNDELDVDVKFIAYANDGQAGVYANITYVSFFTP